jgi:hypothetical protein
MADVIELKTCSSCKEALTLSAFSAAPNYSDGYRGQCKKCRAGYTAGYKARTNYKPPRKYKKKRQSYAALRQQMLRQKYGISQSDFDALLAIQGGCAICLSPTPRGGRHNSFVVDHCHETGRVRGILCHPCNIALGVLGDTPEAIFRAWDHVSKGQPLRRVA